MTDAPARRQAAGTEPPVGDLGVVQTVQGWLASGGGLIAETGGRFEPRLLTAGLLLHLVADVVRNGGWFSVIRAARPAGCAIRRRDVQVAAFAGGGVNVLVPARACDVVKIALLRRRAPDAPVATLASTLVPETLFEFAAGLTLLVWALAAGYLPVEVVAGALGGARDHLAVVAVAVVALALAGTVAIRRIRRRGPGIYRDLAAGFTILGRPRDFAAGVVSWQLAARVIRLGAIACCLAACGLPAGVAAAALAMAVEGGTRLRFAPASVGLKVGLLVYGLGAVAGGAVSLGPVIAYAVGVRSIRAAGLIAIGIAALGATLGTRSPRRALALARQAVGAAADPPAPPEPLAAPAPASTR
jgi:hypothetical protein